MLNKEIRLAKFLADSGVASRRKAEEIILAGRVKVNGRTIKILGTKVDPTTDKIQVDDQLIQPEKMAYYLLNKPSGYVCSVFDPHNELNVLSLVPAKPRVYPVGRLDKDSQGLLLLTNDGLLAYQLTHPKFKVEKKYLVKVNKIVTPQIISQLKKGIQLEEGLAKADQAKQQNSHELIIVIHQGWKRQIRRMLVGLNYQVVALTRLGEGKLTLGSLPLGKYKKINKEDII